MVYRGVMTRKALQLFSLDSSIERAGAPGSRIRPIQQLSTEGGKGKEEPLPLYSVKRVRCFCYAIGAAPVGALAALLAVASVPVGTVADFATYADLPA